MSMFIRVRYSTPGSPLHEFDIPAGTYERHRDRYKVIDRKPVAKQRPASHFPGVVPEPRKAARPKRAPKTGEDTIAPSVGLTPEEDK